MPTDNNIEDVIKRMQELSLRNMFQTEVWKVFFEREEMRYIMIDPRFLRAIGDCVYLKNIGADLYNYFNEQFNIIAGYFKEYGVDYAESDEMKALGYARKRVKAAYQSEASGEKTQGKRVGAVILAIVAFGFPIFSRYMIAWDNQNRAQEQRERMEQYKEYEQTIMEQQNMIIEQNDQWMRDMFEQDPETAQAIKLHLDELLEDGSISKEVYDELIKKYGFDQTESGEEAAEE